jgi:hypothetical protein
VPWVLHDVRRRRSRWFAIWLLGDHRQDASHQNNPTRVNHNQARHNAPQFRTVKNYHDYFSPDSIIRELCRERLNLANARHEANLLHRVSTDQPSSTKVRCTLAADLEGIFPKRRLWQKFRKGLVDRKAKDAQSVKHDSLRTAVRVLMRENPDEQWALQLRARVARIRDRALHDVSFRFTPPVVVGAEKNPGEHEYRPISMYGTDDKIIERLTARYLRDCLDFCFSTSSMAYRVRQPGQKSAVSHHDALSRITNFRLRLSRVFVAEADLRNFMDCIDHGVARKSLDDLIRQGKSLRPNLEIAPRAIQIFNAYLASYSFKQQVIGQGLDTLRKKDPGASFPWPETILRKMHGSDHDLSGIGIPQGGAISCFITNVVLHEADQAIEELRKHNGLEFEYLRYCDDMLLLFSDAASCQQALTAYQRVVEGKKLPMHTPVEISASGSHSESKWDFWNLKSKKPYLWSRAADSGIPWIQFVGYLIRYDGLVRIRQKSLKKHRKKLTDATDKLLKIINPGKRSKDGIPVYAPGLRMDRHQIYHRFRMKLISMSVGRRELWQSLPVSGDQIMPLCWAHGYRGLWNALFDSSALKELDRHRDRQLRRIRRCISYLDSSDSLKEAVGKKKSHRHYGALFSYYGQFAGCGRSGPGGDVGERIPHLRPSGRMSFIRLP